MVIARRALKLDLQKIDSSSADAEPSAVPEKDYAADLLGEKELSPIQQVLSFHCYIEEERGFPERSSGLFLLADEEFRVEALRVPLASDPASEYIDRYGYLSALLVKGFHYGGLMSMASLDPDRMLSNDSSLLAGGSFLLTELELLSDMDIFLGEAWILEREDLRELYPYHLHLQNYVELFRRQYRMERGRL